MVDGIGNKDTSQYMSNVLEIKSGREDREG